MLLVILVSLNDNALKRSKTILTPTLSFTLSSQLGYEGASYACVDGHCLVFT